MHIVDSAGIAYRIDRMGRAQSSQRVRKFTFGDGYEQRLPDGLNTLEQMFSVNFVNRPEAEMETLIDFFETTQGVTTFAFSPPTYTSISSNIDFSGDTITYNSGTNFTTVLGYEWITVVGSTTGDYGYSLDTGLTSTSTTLYLYNAIGSTDTAEDVTITGAVGVTCEKWSITYPQEGIVSVNATFDRAYQP